MIPDKSFSEVMKKAYDRYDAGRKTYGEFDPVTDQRNLLEEIKEEVLDGINYFVMLHEKITTLEKKYKEAVKDEK